MGKRGFTLVEVIVTLAVVGLLSAILTETFGYMAQQKQQILAQNELAVNMNIALAAITEDMRQGLWVENEGDERLIVVNEDRERICYTLAEDPMQDQHLYNLAGKVLYRQVNQGKRQPIANFIGQFEVRYLNEAGKIAAHGEMMTAVEIAFHATVGEEHFSMKKVLFVGGSDWR